MLLISLYKEYQLHSSSCLSTQALIWTFDAVPGFDSSVPQLVWGFIQSYVWENCFRDKLFEFSVPYRIAFAQGSYFSSWQVKFPWWSLWSDVRRVRVVFWDENFPFKRRIYGVKDFNFQFSIFWLPCPTIRWLRVI